MTRDEVLGVLREQRGSLRAMGVERIALFGSFARGEEGGDSDVDLLVDLGPEVGYFDLIAIREHLEALLGWRVELVPRGAVKRQLRERILGEAIDAA